MRKSLAFLFVFCFTFSCIPTDDETVDGPEDESSLDAILIFETQDAKYPYVFQHKNGERLSGRDIDEDGIVDGLLYQRDNFSELIIIDEQTGLPKTKISSDGIIVEYGFKENNTLLDIAINVNNENSFVRNISIDLEENGNASKLIATTLKANTDINLQGMANALSYAISFGSCLTSIGAYATATAVSGGLAALPAAAYPILACSSFVATFTSIVLESSDSELVQSVAQDLKVYDQFINAATCFNLDISSCSQLLLNKIGEDDMKLQELAEAQQEILEEQLQLSTDLVILGNPSFGQVEIDDSKAESLNIINRGTEPITITSIEVSSDNEQFLINTPFPFTLGAADSNAFSKEISITFAPKDVAKQYTSFLKISNNKYEPFDAKAITATATNKDGAKIRFAGNLNYNEVTVNQPHSEFFDIVNPNLNDDLVVTSIEFQGEPLATFANRFSIKGWKNGTIAPGAKQEVEVVFETTDDTEYDGFLMVNNNLDDVNNKLPVFGKGKELEIRLVGNLDFGEVVIGETKTLPFYIENPNLNDNIMVNNIVLPQGYIADWTSGTIEPLGKQPVNVTFSPQRTGEYKGTIELLNDIDETNNKLPISGMGVDIQNVLLGNWIATWDVETCEPTATSIDTECINHQNGRPYVFLPTANANCQALLCGIMDFNNIRNGNSDTVEINNWEFDGANVTMDIRSNSNGFFFVTRTFKFSGVLDENTNTIIGQYESEFIGGGTAGWKNKATGSLTLTKE